MAYNQVYSASVTTATDVGPSTAVGGYRSKIGSVTVLNTTAAVAYLQIFPLPASSVTLGTTVPIASFGMPASGGFTLNFGETGWRVGGTGLSIAGTTTRTGASTAALAVNFIYD